MSSVRTELYAFPVYSLFTFYNSTLDIGKQTLILLFSELLSARELHDKNSIASGIY